MWSCCIVGRVSLLPATQNRAQESAKMWQRGQQWAFKRIKRNRLFLFDRISWKSTNKYSPEFEASILHNERANTAPMSLVCDTLPETHNKMCWPRKWNVATQSSVQQCGANILTNTNFTEVRTMQIRHLGGSCLFCNKSSCSLILAFRDCITSSREPSLLQTGAGDELPLSAQEKKKQKQLFFSTQGKRKWKSRFVSNPSKTSVLWNKSLACLLCVWRRGIVVQDWNPWVGAGLAALLPPRPISLLGLLSLQLLCSSNIKAKTFNKQNSGPERSAEPCLILEDGSKCVKLPPGHKSENWRTWEKPSWVPCSACLHADCQLNMEWYLLQCIFSRVKEHPHEADITSKVQTWQNHKWKTCSSLSVEIYQGYCGFPYTSTSSSSTQRSTSSSGSVLLIFWKPASGSETSSFSDRLNDQSYLRKIINSSSAVLRVQNTALTCQATLDKGGGSDSGVSGPCVLLKLSLHVDIFVVFTLLFKQKITQHWSPKDPTVVLLNDPGELAIDLAGIKCLTTLTFFRHWSTCSLSSSLVPVIVSLQTGHTVSSGLLFLLFAWAAVMR